MTLPPPAETDRFRTGTLRYTKWGLASLFLWMLWGDFCFTMMELLIPRLLPLQMRELGASNALIGVFVGSVPGVMSFFVNPVVSFHSDRHRSRWGRRIPFLLWPTPFISLFLILLAYSDAIGNWVHAILPKGGWTTAGTTIGVVGVIVVGFQFFNIFVAGVYYYLFNDVVPKAFLGRFMALFRMVGTLAGFFFNRYVFGWAESHMKEVYLAVAILYLLAFVGMCLRVKEGEYPPPPDMKDPGVMGSVRTYFRECYSHRHYLLVFLSTSIWGMSSAAMTFQVFFAQGLGMTLGEFGKVMGWTSLLTAALMYPFGILVDRIHPLRTTLLSALLITPFNLVFFFFVKDPGAYLIVSLLFVPLTAMYLASLLPTYMVLFPSERYGQFCSAQGMLASFLLILSSFLAGQFIDWMGSDYRYLFVWMFSFQAIGLVLKIFVYRNWVRLGAEGYVPPAVGPSPWNLSSGSCRAQVRSTP